jgi:hypothetical protein
MAMTDERDPRLSVVTLATVTNNSPVVQRLARRGMELTDPWQVRFPDYQVGWIGLIPRSAESEGVCGWDKGSWFDARGTVGVGPNALVAVELANFSDGFGYRDWVRSADFGASGLGRVDSLVLDDEPDLVVPILQAMTGLRRLHLRSPAVDLIDLVAVLDSSRRIPITHLRVDGIAADRAVGPAHWAGVTPAQPTGVIPTARVLCCNRYDGPAAWVESLLCPGLREIDLRCSGVAEEILPAIDRLCRDLVTLDLSWTTIGVRELLQSTTFRATTLYWEGRIWMSACLMKYGRPGASRV